MKKEQQLKNLIKKQLKVAGYKMTPQREATVTVLVQNRDHHLTAEKIFMLTKQLSNDIGLATVYRTIELLTNIKVLKKSSFDQDGIVRYELIQNQGIQLICKNCGRVIEVDQDFMTYFSKVIAKDYNFMVNDDFNNVHIEGLCSECVTQVAVQNNA
ncbi:Fur family transcriptional regulator [Agrilactobacillus yilanensis]|uniref:Fur family transcriptional regulator n=1 Tax=Agrilactobacillus yilanensis TaxID=2485997 RepID=A0ABW4J9J3_9LACO|nr:Fur family transcriptional regulator [Agrilactobacillus yilanensis]